MSVQLRGRVTRGFGHFTKRMQQYPEVFARVTGERLYRGTLNVDVGIGVPVREHFRIRGAEIGEPEQDLQFEICRVKGRWAYRIVPCHIHTGFGGHGDNTLEIACAQRIPGLKAGSVVTVELFR